MFGSARMTEPDVIQQLSGHWTNDAAQGKLAKETSWMHKERVYEYLSICIVTKKMDTI